MGKGTFNLIERIKQAGHWLKRKWKLYGPDQAELLHDALTPAPYDKKIMAALLEEDFLKTEIDQLKGDPEALRMAINLLVNRGIYDRYVKVYRLKQMFSGGES